MVLGTPTTGRACSPCSRRATPRVSSPPIAISASRPRSAKARTHSSPPPGSLKGLVRELPRIVPPRGRIGADDVPVERHRLALEQAPPAPAQADVVVAVVARARPHGGADDRVQPGAVAAAGEHSDAHRATLAIPRRRQGAAGRDARRPLHQARHDGGQRSRRPRRRRPPPPRTRCGRPRPRPGRTASAAAAATTAPKPTARTAAAAPPARAARRDVRPRGRSSPAPGAAARTAATRAAQATRTRYAPIDVARAVPVERDHRDARPRPRRRSPAGSPRSAAPAAPPARAPSPATSRR